jgi:hypothetical protein
MDATAQDQKMFAGIDVSKDQLDVHIHPAGEAFSVTRSIFRRRCNILFVHQSYRSDHGYFALRNGLVNDREGTIFFSMSGRGVILAIGMRLIFGKVAAASP